MYDNVDLTPYFDSCQGISPCPYELWMEHMNSRLFTTMDVVKEKCAANPTA